MSLKLQLNIENKSKPYLTKREEEIITTFTKKGIKELIEHRVNDAFELHDSIEGVRTDGLLSLAHYYTLGHIPTNQQEDYHAMEKLHSRLFLAPNPDSENLPSDIDWGTNKPRDLGAAIDQNLKLFGLMDVRCSIATNLGHIIYKHGDKLGMNDTSRHEGIISELAEAVNDQKDSPTFTHPLLRKFKTVVGPEDTETIREYLHRLSGRSGALVLYGKEIYNHSVSCELIDGNGEITVGRTDNKIDLKTIIGFEARGEWEVDLLKYLEAKLPD